MKKSWRPWANTTSAKGIHLCKDFQNFHVSLNLFIVKHNTSVSSRNGVSASTGNIMTGSRQVVLLKSANEVARKAPCILMES
jgi:hypothetical protein